MAMIAQDTQAQKGILTSKKSFGSPDTCVLADIASTECPLGNAEATSLLTSKLDPTISPVPTLSCIAD